MVPAKNAWRIRDSLLRASATFFTCAVEDATRRSGFFFSSLYRVNTSHGFRVSRPHPSPYVVSVGYAITPPRFKTFTAAAIAILIFRFVTRNTIIEKLILVQFRLHISLARFHTKISFDERIQITVQYRLRIGCLDLRAMIFHHLIRMQNVRSNLVSHSAL